GLGLGTWVGQMTLFFLEVRPGGSQADGGGYSDCHGGPPSRLVFAPQLLCSIKDLALRSTRRPLSNHPNEPLAPMRH
ncbi:MAG: hypothetical protein WBP34_00245, partial [Thermoanaerobaculia bacterium]